MLYSLTWIHVYVDYLLGLHYNNASLSGFHDLSIDYISTEENCTISNVSVIENHN